jgi:hypothetical protein
MHDCIGVARRMASRTLIARRLAPVKWVIEVFYNCSGGLANAAKPAW